MTVGRHLGFAGYSMTRLVLVASAVVGAGISALWRCMCWNQMGVVLDWCRHGRDPCRNCPVQSVKAKRRLGNDLN